MPKITVVESSTPGITVWEGPLAQVPAVDEPLCVALADGSVLERKVLSVTPPGSYIPLNDSHLVVVADDGDSKSSRNE